MNRHVSYLNAKLGDESDALERDWVERFYDVGDVEGKTLNEGDMIEFISPTTAMGTPQPSSKNKRDLDNLNKVFDQTQQTWADADNIGSQTVATDHRTSELYQKSNDGFTSLASKEIKVRQGKPGYEGQFKFVIYKEYPY